MSDLKYNSPIQMEIVDPETNNPKEPITNIIPLKDKLLVVKPNGVFQIFLPEEIDKDHIAPNTKPTYTKLLSVGSNNTVLSLGFIQFKPLIDFSNHNDEILYHLWNTIQYLLKCEESLLYIYNETDKRIKLYDNIIEENKGKTYIPLLPSVPNLDNYIFQFLINAKHYLINLFKIFNIILKTPNMESNFEAYYKWFKDREDQYKEICLILKKDIPWIKKISNLRNALEHPGEGQKIEIRNFALLPENKFMPPSWKYDLSNKGCGKQDNFCDIVNDISIMLNNILSFQEDIIVLSLNQEFKDKNMCSRIYKKDNISPNCKNKFFISRMDN